MNILIKTVPFIKKQIVNIKTYGLKELFRKLYILIKILIRVPIDIIAILPCMIIRILRPWFLIRVQEAPSQNFGDFIGFIAIYYCKKKLRIDQPIKKCLDLLYIHHKDKIHNKQIAKMWKKKINFLSSYLLDPIYRINKFIPGGEVHTIKSLKFCERDINNLYKKIKILDFTKEEKIYGDEILRKFGLKNQDKLVMLDVRDGAYQLKKIQARDHDWSYHKFRHTDVNKFTSAAEELATRGYFVFRMGNIVEKPFSMKNPKIIDYANSNLRSDFMDIYLGYKCSFCITTGSGFWNLPEIFNKPIIDLSVPIGDKFTHREEDLLITKHHFLKKEKRKLSLSEIFSFGLAYANDTKFFEQKGIELIENTPEEIKEVVIEMIEKLEFKKNNKPKDEELQKAFKNLYASNLKLYNHKNSKSLANAIIHGKIKSSFGNKFLRDNKDWLK